MRVDLLPRQNEGYWIIVYELDLRYIMMTGDGLY